jgi:hypothetical protein
VLAVAIGTTPITSFAADDPSAEARAAFLTGTALVEKAQWAEALAAFEQAGKLRPHPVTTYNIGACERAIGRYTRAKGAFERALEMHAKADGGRLPDHLLEDTRALVAQLDELLARAELTLVPRDATIAIDGRPLDVRGTIALAGTRAPGPGEKVDGGTVTVVLDPGAHVITVAAPGFGGAVLNRTFAPGSKSTLRLALDELPAVLRVSADKPGAIVRIDGTDLGPAPLEVLRPAGRHQIVVTKVGHVAYETNVTVRAGEAANLRATLREETPAITSRWWFWGVAVGAVAIAAGTTWALTRPEPTRPDPGGGTLGWSVAVP